MEIHVWKCRFPLAEERKKQKTLFSHTAGSPRTSMWGVSGHMAYVRFRFCFTICHCLTCRTHLWRMYQVEVCLFFFSVFVSQLCCCLNKDQDLWFDLAWLPVVCENISFHVQLYISIIHCIHLGDIGWTLEEIYSISSCMHSNVLSCIYHQVLYSQQTHLNCLSVTNTLSLFCMPRNHFSPQHYPVSPVKSMNMNICLQLYLTNTNPGFKANKGINISITKQLRLKVCTWLTIS